jgi:hypothetical protein
LSGKIHTDFHRYDSVFVPPFRASSSLALGSCHRSHGDVYVNHQPLHYACAYGATEQALRVLTDGNIRTITAVDNRGRTPLHFALGNADRPASPGVVSILLSQDRSVVNAIDLESNLPIHLLRTCALAINAEEKDKIDNCQRCFGLYLDARPRAEGHLLMGIQGLPDWLRDYAVVSPVVQSILNVKIAKRFPTAVILMDIFFYVIVVILFPFAVVESITDRADDIPEGGGGGEWKTRYLTPLYLASAYFFVREVVQMLSLASMGQFNTWVVNFENWLDMLYSFLVMFWSVVMALEAFPLEVFQPAAALSLAVFWIMILSFLRNMNVAFAVFVHGVLYVTKRLAAFLVSLVIILFAFTQIFTTLFQQSDQCTELISFQGFPLNTTTFDTADPVNVDTSESCEPEITFPFCSFIPSFIRVFSMLLGEVKDDDFVGEKLETFFYALFFFSCVIVLASVLIAVVVDSYRVIQDERAGEFESNCLANCLCYITSEVVVLKIIASPSFITWRSCAQRWYSGPTGLISSQRWMLSSVFYPWCGALIPINPRMMTQRESCGRRSCIYSMTISMTTAFSRSNSSSTTSCVSSLPVLLFPCG